MAPLLTRLVCLLLAASFLSAAVAIQASGEPYVLSIEDPVDYPENPAADLKSLVTYVDGPEVIVEIAVYGNISDEPEYSYSFGNYHMYEGTSIISFYYFEGNGTYEVYGETGSVMLYDIWEVEGDTLRVSIPGQYVCPPEYFNLTVTASWCELDTYYNYTSDFINEINYSYDMYDFENAVPLAVPDSIHDSVDEGESRVYEMELAAGDGVLITLNGSLGDWPGLTIFDSEQEYVTGTVSMTRDVSMTFVPTEAGAYYLAVESWSVSGGFDLTTSFRGGSGEAYQRAAPDAVPWQAGDEWSAGGYISTDDLLDQLLEEAGIAGIFYSVLFPDLETEGGIADFLLVTYMGEEAGQHRFDFRCRLYADITVNMTMVSGSEAYTDDELTSEYTSTSYMNATGTVDVDYTGSIWLGYYEAQDGTGYWGAEKQVIDLAGALEVYMGMDDSATYTGMEEMNYDIESETWMSADLEIGLSMTNEPGIPFLPAGNGPLSVDKKSATAYEGSMDADIRSRFEFSDSDEYPNPELEDMNETYDSEFDGSYVGYYVLDYDPGSNIASMVPLMTDPFSFLMLAMSNSLEYYEVAGDPYPYWLDYGNSEAAFDPDSGFYTTFELPLNPLSGTAMSLGGESGGDSQVESLGMLSLLSNLAMDDVSGDDAEAFFENPAGYIAKQEEGSSLPTFLAVAIFIAVISVVVAVALITHRRRPTPPAQPPEQGPGAQP